MIYTVHPELSGPRLPSQDMDEVLVVDRVFPGLRTRRMFNPMIIMSIAHKTLDRFIRQAWVPHQQHHGSMAIPNYIK
ncbi:hypothetical protein PGTUg99_019380 [Puccinia graminis f. sp. tritici]|uniref:Uncharacterized protein n=1 Tax=Puccinia graminis f. sp. tritici TaxID=56615 RepID=A0A5B0NFN9_PUCGR|nr:hypothetical protein PGTUg99_019380 [Puccinia graminis f. sp. tritici]